jgi:DUF3015 family protein
MHWKRLTMEICGMGAVCLLSACVTKPTVDVTKAPFKATTDLAEAPTRASSELMRGTTDATVDLTEPTKEFTSSTSPRSWFTQDGVLKVEYKLMAFTVWNYENLRENLAQARGEYLESYATLLGIAPTNRAKFYVGAQRRYGSVFSDDMTAIQSVNILLKDFQITPP